MSRGRGMVYLRSQRCDHIVRRAFGRKQALGKRLAIEAMPARLLDLATVYGIGELLSSA